MSIYNPSILVDAQVKFQQGMMAGEWRLPDTAVLSTMANGEMTNPALAVIRRLESQTPKAYLPIRKASSNGTVRAHNHTGNSGDSKEVDVSWQTYTETFGINLDRGLNNVFSFQEQYNADLRSCILNLLERHEVNVLTKLKAEYTDQQRSYLGWYFQSYFIPNVGRSCQERLFLPRNQNLDGKQPVS